MSALPIADIDALVAPRPRIQTADALLGMDLPELRWAVPWLVPEGLTILAGRPKLGKSRFCLDIAVGVSLGATVLGKIDAPQAGVLLLSLEDGPRRLQQRLEQALGTRPAPRSLRWATEWPRLDQGGADELHAALDANPDIGLVVIDVLAKVRLPQTSRGNAYQEDFAAVAAIKAVADAHPGLALVVVHHTRKVVADDPLDSVSGSTGLTGAADSVLVLSRDRSSADAALYVRGRDVQEADYALTSNERTGGWTLEGRAEAFRLSAERKAILDALVAAGGKGKRVRDIALFTGPRNEQAVRMALSRMVRDGQVVKVGTGLYAAPSQSPLFPGDDGYRRDDGYASYTSYTAEEPCPPPDHHRDNGPGPLGGYARKPRHHAEAGADVTGVTAVTAPVALAGSPS